MDSAKRSSFNQSNRSFQHAFMSGSCTGMLGNRLAHVRKEVLGFWIRPHYHAPELSGFISASKEAGSEAVLHPSQLPHD